MLARAHYLPLFSRLGGYDTALLDEAAWGRKRRWFEYWGHEASLLPFALHPLLRWRMAAAANGEAMWPGLSEFQRAHGDYIRGVRAHIEAHGPAVASELDGAKSVAGWWGWGQAKRALEILFWSGELTTSGRRGFERVYDLTERVLPPEILAIPTPAKDDAQRALLLLSARAHGIGTAGCLADYFRISPRVARPLLADLVEDGKLLPVEVEGLRGEWLLHKDCGVPRKVAAQALLVPFDPLVWERGRVAKLFSFQYRVEIYTPAEKRVHGYYVLPFLLGDRLGGARRSESGARGGPLACSCGFRRGRRAAGNREGLVGRTAAARGLARARKNRCWQQGRFGARVAGGGVRRADSSFLKKKNQYPNSLRIRFSLAARRDMDSA